MSRTTYCQQSNKNGMLTQQEGQHREAARMFVTKDRPGAGSRNRQDRTIEDTASRMEGHGSLRPFAEHTQGRREAAHVELKRRLRASEETLQRLIEASLQGVLKVSGPRFRASARSPPT